MFNLNNTIMTTLNEMLFPVRIVETSELVGFGANSDYSHAVVGTIDGEDKILNVCSDRYELVPNEAIFPVVEKMLNDRNINFTASYKMTNHAVFSASYIIEDETYFVGSVNDQIKPRFEILHSYNGLQIYTICLGYYRLVCTNGLVIPFEGTEEKNLMITGKHTQKILTSFDTLFDMIPMFFDRNPEFIARFEVLYAKKIKAGKLKSTVEKVMEKAGLTPVKRYNKNGKKSENSENLDDVLATIRTELAILNETDANNWLVYNAINAFIFNDEKNKKSQSKRRELDKKVLAELMK